MPPSIGIPPIRQERLFRDILREFRQGSNITIEDICNQMGFKKSYLMHLEQGVANVPSAEVVKNLCKAMHLNRDQQVQLFEASLRERKTLILSDLPDVLKKPIYDLIVGFYVGN